MIRWILSLLLLLALPARAAPVLNSRLGSPNTLYLDFDGELATTIGSFAVGPVPAYESQASIPFVFDWVANAFKPFDVDVTTVDRPASHKVIIGGNGSALGYSYGPTGSTPGGGTTGYVFSLVMANNPLFVAEMVAHEAGHTYGLDHQSLWVNGVPVSQYNPGDGTRSPIMGNPFNGDAQWWIGLNEAGVPQDDVKLLTGWLGPAPTSIPEPTVLAPFALLYFLQPRSNRAKEQFSQ